MSLVLDSIEISLNQIPLFTPLSLSVEPGTIVTIMGPSGCGKSTLLASICGMLDPGFLFTGTITLNNRRLNNIDMEHRKVGILFQDDLLFPHLDVFGNMAFGLPARMNRSEKREHVARSLAAAGLEGFAKRDIATLSGGQKARVSLLRALLAEPEAILLDEPFSKLDDNLRDSIKEFVFEQIGRLNIPALLVTHDRSDSADGNFIELR
ncbi:MAG: ATP-binding cassette domain-containing protein [Desulfobulbaceae bacterium]|nr:ATP-binding cassette domain-containing protein [Desulfofustis sp.]RZW21136.1 MAG: ATP-binding cassette domain-containing protein [Desulfobulbaceae bacterium]